MTDTLDHLIASINKIKNNPNLSTFGEPATKQAIIIPILQFLQWNPSEIDEVYPEYRLDDNKRVDYSLRLNNNNKVFLEVKKVDEDLEKHQEQLLYYSFRFGVDLAILTNGVTWWFYLPKAAGDWKARKFYAIDLIEQEADDIASKLLALLSKQNISSGKALVHAEAILKDKLRKKNIIKTLPEAWNKIIIESDPIILELLSETTEKICGYKPDTEEVEKFLKHHIDKFKLLPEAIFKPLPKDHAIALYALPEEIPPLYQNKYFNLFSDLVDRIKGQIPYDRIKLSTRNYCQISTGISGVHFEWWLHSRPTSRLEVGLHFEKSDKKLNIQMIERLEHLKDAIDKNLGEKVTFQKDWAKAWSRLFVEKQAGELTEELKIWAVEKMVSLIKLLKPELEKMKNG